MAGKKNYKRSDNPNVKSKTGELKALLKAKTLAQYVFTVTDNAPKRFRFTFTTRMQNMTLDIIECLFLANGVYVEGPDAEALMRERAAYQRKALTLVKTLAYIAEIARAMRVILPKHYEQICNHANEVAAITTAWMNSDERRFKQRGGLV